LRTTGNGAVGRGERDIPVRHRSAIPRLRPKTAHSRVSGCLCGITAHRITKCGRLLRHVDSRHRRLRRHTGECVADRLDTAELGQENRRGETDHDRRVGTTDLPRGTKKHRGTRAHAAVQQRSHGLDARVEVLPKPWRVTFVPRLTVPTPVRLPVREPGVTPPGAHAKPRPPRPAESASAHPQRPSEPSTLSSASEACGTSVESGNSR